MAYRTAPLPTSELLTPYVPPSVIVTQFQAGHGFTATGADASSNLNDTSNFVTGTQAATLVTAGAGATTYLLHKGLSAVNMTGRQFAVVIECDNLTHIASSGPLEFLAGSGASTSTTYQWQLSTSGTIDQNLLQGGLWIYYTLNFADATVNGSPARTALTDFYIRLNDDSTGNKVTVRVNAIYAIPDGGGSSMAGPLGYPSGVASVCLDDGFSSQLANAKPVLDSYGYTPTTFVIWDQVGLSGRLTAAQYLAMQDISGWEVNSHSLTDADHTAGFDNITAAGLETNAAAQQAIMAANGFQGKGSAYPKGQLTPAVRAMLRKYFAYVRGTFNKTLETWPPADIFNLRAVSSISPLSGGYAPSLISQSQGLIDEAVASRRWLILVFHKIIGNVTSCVSTTGTTYRITYSDTSPPYNTSTSVTLQGFSPSGLNGTYTITADGTTGGFGYIEVSIPANPGNASVQGTALSATTDCDLASYTAIIAKLNSAGIPVRTIAAVLTGQAYGPGYVPDTAVGAAGGVASLDSSGNVPAAELGNVAGLKLAKFVYAPSAQVVPLVSTTSMAAFNLAATTVASGSNGGEISQVASWSSPSAGVLDVAATTNWPTSGTVTVAASGATTAIVNYAGITGGSLTGCTYASGSPTGTVSTGGAVTLTSLQLSTGSFTAPPSGQVTVRVSFAAKASTSSNWYALGLAAHGTVTPLVADSIVFEASTSDVSFFVLEFTAGSLMPGTSYNFDLLGSAESAVNFAIWAFGQMATAPTFSSAGQGAPVTITVLAD